MQDTEHHISRSFAHDLSSWVVTGVKQMKTYTEYYTFKAIFVEKDEDWLQLNNWGYSGWKNLEWMTLLNTIWITHPQIKWNK